MYEGGCDNDSGSKVFGNEESPRRNSDALMPRSEDGKPCAQKRSDQNDEDGGDADAHAPVKVVVNRTVTHDVQFIQMEVPLARQWYRIAVGRQDPKQQVKLKQRLSGTG